MKKKLLIDFREGEFSHVKNEVQGILPSMQDIVSKYDSLGFGALQTDELQSLLQMPAEFITAKIKASFDDNSRRMLEHLENSAIRFTAEQKQLIAFIGNQRAMSGNAHVRRAACFNIEDGKVTISGPGIAMLEEQHRVYAENADQAIRYEDATTLRNALQDFKNKYPHFDIRNICNTVIRQESTADPYSINTNFVLTGWL